MVICDDIVIPSIKVKKGIRHIDDVSVPIEQFINVIKNIQSYEITEKVDGNNLKFGLDSSGLFYTSRIGKEGGYYYTQSEWGNTFKDIAFKSVHSVLLKYTQIYVNAGMKPGDIIEVEILYGNKPNAIPYNPNQIIFLRTIIGDIDIDKIISELLNIKTTINICDAPYTCNGRTTIFKNITHIWTFSKVCNSKYNTTLVKKTSKIISKLELFINQPNVDKLELLNTLGHKYIPTNLEILLARTNNRNKITKKNISYIIDGNSNSNIIGFRPQIKNILLSNLVLNTSSQFGPSIKNGGWIEGVVLKRTCDGVDELWKVVNKNLFTMLNTFNYDIRNSIFEKHRSINSLNNKAGMLGNVLRDMATIIGHPLLGTIQAKRYIKTYGNNKKEILSSLTSTTKYIVIQKKWLCCLVEANKSLSTMLLEYNNNKDSKIYIDITNRVHTYDSTIHIRTLQGFATAFSLLADMKKMIINAKTQEDLFFVLIKDKIL